VNRDEKIYKINKDIWDNMAREGDRDTLPWLNLDRD